MLTYVLALVFALAGVSGSKRGESITIIAEPQEPEHPYVPEEIMRSVCDMARTKMGFVCRAAWESGAIGSFSPNGRLPDAKPNNDTERLNAFESLVTKYAKVSTYPLQSYAWSVEFDVALHPIASSDGTYVWLPDRSCERIKTCVREST